MRAFGATESFPPDDADIIGLVTSFMLIYPFRRVFDTNSSHLPAIVCVTVDNTATGSTLKANGLHIVHTLFHSSTRLFANRKAMEDPAKKQVIDELVLLLRSVLVGRGHMLVEFNISKEQLDAALPNLPCMRAPTISPLGLQGDRGYAVRLAVKKNVVAKLLPQLKQWGASDIIVSALQQIVP